MTNVNPNPEAIKEILSQSKTIAVVGLSDDPTRTSHQVAKHMLDAGYNIIPVNPNADEVFGIKAVKTLSDVEESIDIVNVFRRSEFLHDIAKEAVAIGAKVFWAQLGLYNDEAYEYLKDKGVTVVMDRCIKVEHSQLKW